MAIVPAATATSSTPQPTREYSSLVEVRASSSIRIDW